MINYTHRQFLTQTAAAGIAAAASRHAASAAESTDSDSRLASRPGGGQTMETRSMPVTTYREYLEESAVPRNAIDDFIGGSGWAQFDPEIGYVLRNSLQADGIDNSSTISTVQANGARRSFLYAGKKPRINTYGNSFALCQQVSDGETWQEYLAAHLGEPIGNFGMGGLRVYQAYRRMIREEESDHAAEFLILYIWGDDPIRSLFRARWAINYPYYKTLLGQGRGFSNNF